MSKKEECPCGRALSYEDCCGRIHRNIHNAKTAEDLMRSRYTAYTMGLGDYLMKSHYSTRRPLDEKEAIVKWAKSVKWKGLEIISTDKGGYNDHVGLVKFKAHYKNKLGGRECIDEHSVFIRENNHWSYFGIREV